MVRFQAADRSLSRLPGPLGTALLLHLAFSSAHFAFCVWFAFIPLLISARRHPPRQALVQGLISGFIFYYLNLSWITNSIRNFSALPLPLVWLVLALLALYLSLYFGLFCLLLAVFPAASWFSTLFLASSWTLLEWLRGTILVGFPWNNLGIAIAPTSPFAFLLPYGGVYTLSFLIIYANLSLYALTSSRGKGPLVRRQAAALLAVPALYFLLLAGGSHAGADNLDHSRPITVSIIQPNIPQAEKWVPACRERNFSILEQLSLEEAAESKPGTPHLVIWPEASLPDFFQDAPILRRRLETLTRQGHFYLLVGSPQYNPIGKGQYQYFNSVLLFSPDGRLAADYNKIKLVPFGEFTPLASLFPFLGKMVEGADFTAGRRLEPMKTGSFSLSPSICYEGIFPEFTAAGMAKKAGFLVNITNDAWFGDSDGPRQHLMNVQPRAMENRCYLLRCANTGISAVIGPDGRIISRLPLNTRGRLRATIYPAARTTFYARHPYLPILLLALTAAFSAVIARRSRPATGFS